MTFWSWFLLGGLSVYLVVRAIETAAGRIVAKLDEIRADLRR